MSAPTQDPVPELDSVVPLPQTTRASPPSSTDASDEGIEAELSTAIAGGMLRAHFQLVVDLRDGRVTGMEALVRWPRTPGPMLLPDEFLPVAEAAGLLPDVGQWMLDQVLHALNRLRGLQLDRQPRVWINLGATEVAGADEVLGRIEAAISDGSLSPREIGFEVTESAMLADVDRAVGSLVALRQLGVEIALDDFGTGYSSLSHLRTLPVSAVKIDRSFVAGLGRSDADGAIVRAVIDLAHALGLRAVAEGVEDVEQADELRRLGADEAQGFLFGAPAPIDQLDERIRLRWAGTEPFASRGMPVDPAHVDRRPSPLPGEGSPLSRLLLTALDTAHDAMVVTTTGRTAEAHQVVYVNRRFETDLGIDAASIVGRSLDALLPEVRRDRLHAWYERAFANGRAVSQEVQVTRANGTTYPCEVTISPIFDERGVLTHWLHTSRDITERRRLETEQRERGEQRELLAPISELARRAVVDSITDVLAHLDDVIARFAGHLGCDLMFVHLLDGEQLRTAAWWSRDGGPAEASHDPVSGINEARRWSTTVDAVLEWLRLVDDHGPITTAVPGSWNAELRTMLGGHPLGTPLFAAMSMNGVLLGVLGATREQPGSSWTTEEVAAVEELANLVASLLQRQQTEAALHNDMRAAATRAAYERVQMEVAEWALGLEAESLADGLDIHLQHIVEVLGADSVSVITFEGDELRRMARWPRSPTEPLGGPPRLMYRDLLDKLPDLEPLVVHDITTSDAWYTTQWRANPNAPRAMMIVPLGASGQLDGALAIGCERRARHWADGEVNFARAIAATISSVIGRRRMEASLRLAESRLEAMLDGSSDFIIVVDERGAVRYANLAVRRTLGRTTEAMVGRPGFELIHTEDRPLAVERFATLMRGEPNENTRVRALRDDGTIAGWWEILSGAQHDPVVGGTILTCRDITARVAAEQAEAVRVERLRHTFALAQRALDVGPDVFIAELDTACADISRTLGADMVRVVQYDESHQTMTVGGCSDPRPEHDDRATTPFATMSHWLDRLREPEPVHVPTVAGCDEPWAGEWRSRTGCHGGLLVVAMSVAGQLVGELAVAMREDERQWDDGALSYLRLVAETIAHVLERSRLDAALRFSETRYRILSETAADVVVLIDEGGIVGYASPSSHALLGYTPAELIGRHAGILLPGGDADLPRLLDERTPRDGSVDAELEMRRADGVLIWVAHSTSVVRDQRPGGRPTYRISVRDITDRKRLETELSWQALHDPLTGLGNRIHLQRRLAGATADDNLGRGLAVLLIDLDRFKRVNDAGGHAQGDEVLQIVAARLSSLIRPTDTLARTGGDEFVLLCPNTDPHDATAIAERMVRVLTEPIAVDGTVVHVGASVGVAHTPSPTSDSDHLLIEADRAMYRAKQAGGSRVVAATATQPLPGTNL